MYSVEEASAARQKFWTTFGKYMQPVPNADAKKINWVNYKTGIKGIFFKMNANSNFASIAIEFSSKNSVLQHQYFQIFTTFTKQFSEIVGIDWVYNEFGFDENVNSISTVSLQLKKVNVFKESDWPTIITFFKTNLIALDTFWVEYKFAFE